VNRSTAGLVAAAVLVLAGWLAIAATADNDSDTPTAGAEASPLPGVCDALASARSGDVEEARVAFFDGAHDGLHELASRTSEVDRAVTADLLRAKERIEALMETSSASDLQSALADLTDATGAAARTLDPEAATSCP
jgi:hypothetical protein